MDLINGAAVDVHISLHVSALSNIGVIDSTIVHASGHPEHTISHAYLAKREQTINDHCLYYLIAYSCIPKRYIIIEWAIEDLIDNSGGIYNALNFHVYVLEHFSEIGLN